jgi:hypothetical protein
VTDSEALDILRVQGHAVSAIDAQTGRVRIWVHGSEDVIELEAGKELWELAEGKLTFDEARELCQPEEPARR